MPDTVLVTGIGGFIAKHVALALLHAGFHVRGSVRGNARAQTVRATLAGAGADLAKLTFVEADLTSDAGWAEAVEGCRYVQHIASPFPMTQPRDREALVPEARAGATRVLDAALKGDVERVVMTSSVVAMMYWAGRPAQVTIGDRDWTDPDWSALSAYIVSKTRAELAAWAYVTERAAKHRLTVVNPGIVFGPALDRDIGTSLAVIQMMLKGKYPVVPPSAYPVVDVRDLAHVHVRAMTKPEAAGRRLIAAADTLSMAEIAIILKQEFGPSARHVPTMTLPGFMVRGLVLLDPALRAVVADIGTRPTVESRYVNTMLDLPFKSAREAVVAAANSLIDHKLA